MNRTREVAVGVLSALLVPMLGCAGTTASNQQPQAMPSSNPTSAGGSYRVEAPEVRLPPAAGTRYVTSYGLPRGPSVALLPDWVINPNIDGSLGAIGVASTNPLGTDRQVDNARLSARLELARMLETRVQEVGRNELEQHRIIGTGGGKGDSGSRRSHLGVDRNITDVVLAGSRQRAMWFAPNGDAYVWIVMDGAVHGLADHNVENGVSVFVAKRAIADPFKPERFKEAKPVPVVAPQPVVEVRPEPSGPTEKLEARLKELETIPVKKGGASNTEKKQP